jgi:hypothetical protein
MLLAIRPDDWNLPLLLHVGGAMVLTGCVTIVAGTMLLARGDAEGSETAALTRFAFRSALFAAIPAFVVMRIFAQVAESKENLENSDASWLGIGYGVGDFGGIVLIITVILLWRASKKVSRDPGSRTVMSTIATGLSLLLLVAYVIAVWAMTTKPT